MKIPIPRPYQEKGIALTRKAFSEGNRKVLFWLATGGGKSVVFLNIVGSLLKNKRKVCVVVRRQQLVLQTQKHFTKSLIDSSIMLNSKKGFLPEMDLQICSIDTIIRRDYSFMKEFDFVLVDEAHDTTSDQYRGFLNSFSEKTKFIGLTATPFKVGKRYQDFWDCVVKPIEVSDLRDLGFLVNAKVFTPTDIDLTQLKDGIDGDYKQKDLAEVMGEMKIVGDVVDNYLLYGENKPAICFCVNKEHSYSMAAMFNSRNIPAVSCDESTPQKERDQAIENLKNGTVKILCNVNIFSTGVDIPEAEVGLMARPTKSEILYIQQVGRLLRPYQKCGKCKSQYDNSEKCPVCGYDKPSYTKSHATIIDFGNNTSRFGLPFKSRVAQITPEKEAKEKDKKERPVVKTCKNCFCTYEAELAKCPNCDGAETKERIIKL
jgi:superfamily II DNA or RNA helicase